MTIQEFKNNGYVHLKNVLDEQSCKNLTEYLKDLVKNKQTYNDPQCPKSEAIHGAEQFDLLLIKQLYSLALNKKGSPSSPE